MSFANYGCIDDAKWITCTDNKSYYPLNGLRVIYLKDTRRRGWIGTIVKTNDTHVWINYDNGCDQRYSRAALEWEGEEDGYIMKLEDHNNGKKLGMNEEFYGINTCEDETPRPTLQTAEYMVVVKNSGKVIPFFTEEEAEQFCSEQITTSHNMQSFAIFKYDFEMSTKAPEVVKSVRKGV